MDKKQSLLWWAKQKNEYGDREASEFKYQLKKFQDVGSHVSRIEWVL